jgi:hypothetical protein
VLSTGGLPLRVSFTVRNALLGKDDQGLIKVGLITDSGNPQTLKKYTFSIIPKTASSANIPTTQSTHLGTGPDSSTP